jgi:hypothetical protein
MNQAAFERFCEDMGTVNADWSARLFLAMDDDNTGSIEASEFLLALRLLCDESGGEAWRQKRLQFCFNLIDLHRDQKVNQSQVHTFLKSLFAEARSITVDMMSQLEDIFGMNVAVVAGGATTHKIRWHEEPSLKCVFELVEQRRLKQYSMMRTVVSEFRERDGEGIGGLKLSGFERWCTSPDENVRLRVLDWLRRLGETWLQRILLSVEGRDQHYDLGHHGHFQHGPGHVSRTAYQVVRMPLLRAQFHQITETSLIKQFGRTDRELTQEEFNFKLERLGVLNPFMRERFHQMFSRTRNARRTAGVVSTQEASSCGFIEPRDFMAGISLLTVHGREHYVDKETGTVEPGKLDQAFSMRHPPPHVCR